jgi:hypothetical protein
MILFDLFYWSVPTLRKNIFAKSMLRQPIRSLLIILLIAAAAFAFVVRAAEYSAIRNHFLGADYHAVGFVDGVGPLDDISHIADFLSDSPHMGMEDRRHSAVGVLPFYSNDILGGTPRSSEDPLAHNYAIFTGTLQSIWVNDADFGDFPGEWVMLHFLPTEIYAGFPEHVGDMAEHHQDVLLWYYQGRGPWGEEVSPDAAIANMEIDGEYLVMGRFDSIATARHPGFAHIQPMFGIFPRPNLFAWDNSLEIVMLDEHSGLWYADSDDTAALENLADRIAFLNHRQRAVTITATKDMTMMPEVLSEDGRHRRITHIFQGRMIDYDDYANSRHVATVSARFFYHRNMELGDILTIEIPANQTLVDMQATISGFDPIIHGDHLVPPAYTLELEVVGFFYGDPAAQIYVPSSVLPNIHVEGIDGLLTSQYSFVLDSARFEQQFYLEYREILLEMAAVLTVLWSEAGDFWQVMDFTMLTSAFNVGLTGAILLLVLLLTTFVFLRQRWRDLAISRATGSSIKRVLLHLMLTVFLFGIPAVAIGGGGGLAFVNSDFYSSELLISLVDIPPPPDVEGMVEEWARIVMRVYEANLPPQIVPDIFSLEFGIALCAATFVLLLIFAMIGSVFVIKRPVLEMLQGGSGVKANFTAAEGEGGEFVVQGAAAKEVSFPRKALPLSIGRRFTGRFGFVLRQIVRSRQKSILTLSIALLFTVSMIYLQESMVRTQDEVDRLYDETVVRAEISTVGWQLVPRRFVDLAVESDMATNIYYEAAFFESFLIAPDEAGGIPENWQEIIGFEPLRPMNSWENWSALDRISGITDLEMFLEVHSNVESGGNWGSIHIDFASSFDVSTFTYSEGSPIPIIVPEQAFEDRSLSFGEQMLLAMRIPRSNPIVWVSYPAVIAGTHNGHVRDWIAVDSIMVPMPFEFFDNVAGREMLYYRINFDVTPEYNRHLYEVLDEFGPAFFALGQRPEIMLWDSQLNELTGAMEWVLLFLELLYPVTLVVAAAISLVLSMLLIMQMGKSAAIMRSLGASKRSVCAALWGEQLGVFVMGIVFGLVAVFALGWGFEPTEILAAAAVCLVGAAIGSLLATIIVVVMRPPIEMLQIRE